MLVHNTEKDGTPVSVTLEQEPTELRGLWAQAAATYIHGHFPDLSMAQLLRCSISTSGSRAASLTILFSLLEEPEGAVMPPPPAPAGSDRE